mmetsp:Transcript_44410/g.69432  ORF Transcript_44410/g.69432 Transcript_44410/m.69432 type:complete len:89 (-) Transcript_44410:42-308(-)
MKPRKFEKQTIQFTSRWKLRSEQGTYIFKGDVKADATDTKLNVPDAKITGEILKETGNENFKKVGSFEAELREKLPPPQPSEPSSADL